MNEMPMPAMQEQPKRASSKERPSEAKIDRIVQDDMFIFKTEAEATDMGHALDSFFEDVADYREYAGGRRNASDGPYVGWQAEDYQKLLQKLQEEFDDEFPGRWR